MNYEINKKVNYSECIVSASSSTANLGPGYDVFGLGLDALEDTVYVKIVENENQHKNNIKIIMSGEGSKNIPTDPEYNSAGRVAKRIISDYNLYKYNCLIKIEKDIPAGYGMGSSAASSVATAIAFKKIFDLEINNTQLLDYAAEGEIASAGVKHYDNVAGSFFGGFVIVKTYPKLEFINTEYPDNLLLVICVPIIEVPKMKTEYSRNVIPKQVTLEKMVYNLANACSIVAGFYSKDIQMICNGINDCIIEPARQKLIPGYERLKERSIQAGGLAFTISGAGPSTIAFVDSIKNAQQVSNAMQKEYYNMNIDCKTFISKPSNGFKIISLK